MYWFGTIIGLLYGSIGFALGFVYVFCETLNTTWCQVSKVLVIFLPSTFMGGGFLSVFQKLLPMVFAVSLAVIFNALLFAVLGYLVDGAIRSLLRK
jgi:hypothetical protein